MPAVNKKISIIIPTYNERDNVSPLVERIRKAMETVWDYEVIIVDDNSPDGTQTVVRQMAAWNPRIRLLERPGKQGLGSAVAAGFALATGEFWVMMDADLSHRPCDIMSLLEGLSEADIVVGSRYVPGGKVVNWPWHREVASRLASALGRLIVGLQVRDLTSGFAAFRRSSIQSVLPMLNPRGFKLLLEIMARCGEAKVKELPITFVERRYGGSKASAMEALVFLRLCFELRALRRRRVNGR